MRLKKRWAEWLESSKGRAGRQSRTLTAWKRVRSMRLAQRFAQWDKALEGRAARRRTRRLGVVNQRNFRLRAGWRPFRSPPALSEGSASERAPLSSSCQASLGVAVVRGASEEAWQCPQFDEFVICASGSATPPPLATHTASH